MPPKPKTNYRRKRQTSMMNRTTATSALKAAVAGYKTYNKYKPKKIIAKKTKIASISGPMSELTIQNYKGGRNPRHNLKSAWKVLKANNQKNVYYMEGCNRYLSIASQPGYFGIRQTFTGSSATGSVIMPLQMFSLSATPNIVAGTTTNPCAGWFLQRSDQTANYYPNFNTMLPWAPQNTAGTTSFVQTYPGQADILKAVSAKFCLYGTLTRPTKYLIQLVQLRKPYLHPDYINNVVTNSGSPIVEPEMGKAAAFYDELTKQFTYSPVTFSDNTQVKDLKIIKSWTHIIQPRFNTENNISIQESSSNVPTTSSMPHSKIFNIYHKFNRAQRYNWNDSTPGAIAINNNNADNIPIIAGQNQTDVQYGARIYLMIRALSPVYTFNNVHDVSAQPSYDLAMRTYHENQG